MKPSFLGTHLAYQSFLLSSLQQNPDLLAALDDSLMKIANMLFQLDLSFVDRLMLNCYSDKGAPPRQPSSMLRCYFLSLLLNCPSLTNWATMLKRVPIYAVISGFQPNDTPGVGTFYDFLHRL